MPLVLHVSSAQVMEIVSCHYMEQSSPKLDAFTVFEDFNSASITCFHVVYRKSLAVYNATYHHLKLLKSGLLILKEKYIHNDSCLVSSFGLLRVSS